MRGGNIWYARRKDEDTVYAFVTCEKWPWRHKKNFLLKNVKATKHTVVSVLGQNDEIIEYQTNVTPKTVWEQREDGLSITAIRAQRIYNDREWPNPVVLKITHAR